MKYFIVVFVLVLLLLGFSNCTKEIIREVEKPEAYYDVKLIKNGWRLDAFLNVEGDSLISKPTDLPQDIYLVFTKDKRALGHIASWELTDGEYTIEENKNISLSFSIPFLMTCCEWDNLFLKEFRYVGRYEVVGNSLKLYYGDNDDMMVFYRY